MNRFHTDKKRLRWFGATGLPPGLFAAMFVCFWIGINSVSKSTDAQKLQSLETAVRRNMVQCYALEGRYPESLAYMEAHYGLTYDKEKYFIDYEIVGSNLMPDVTVFAK